MVEILHAREREVLAKIQKAHRTIDFLTNRSGNAQTPMRAELESDLAKAERYLANKGDKYFPHSYWVESADQLVSSILSVMHVTGWVNNDYEFGVGWKA